MDDFDYGMEEEPKKGFLGGVFTKKDKPVNIQQRSRNMPEQQMSNDALAKILGGQYKGPEDRNMALDYTFNSYEPIGDTYKPISETYQKNVYQPPKWEEFTYESPPYESASGVLFGERGKAWEDSPVFKQTRPGIFQDQTDKSPLYNPTGMSDILFGNKEETPLMSPITGRPMDFPMKNPATQPFQTVTPVTQFSPSPVNIPYQQVVTPVQQMPQFTPPPMPTMPTQVIPPQYVPTAPMKRPVGRPRLNRPPKIKRPVGRPKKIRMEVAQMMEIQ